MNEPVRKRSSPLLTTLFVVAALAIVYPLSLGPVVWFYQHDFLPLSVTPFVEAFYTPLWWVLDEHSRAGGMYARYLDWWDMY